MIAALQRRSSAGRIIIGVGLLLIIAAVASATAQSPFFGGSPSFFFNYGF